jgi:hypothetical protein
MPTNWRTYGKDTLASRLDRAELPGFFRKQIAVGPGEAALILKGGRVEETLTESGAKVAGVWDKVLSWFGLAEDLEVIFVDITPFDIPVFLGTRESEDRGVNTARVSTWEESRTTTITDTADVVLFRLSLDGEVIPAECRVRIRVDLADASKFAGLLRGRPALARWDVAGMVRSELLGPVLLPLIAAHNASDFRGSLPLRDQLLGEARQQMVRGLADWGLTLEHFTIVWGLTEQERAQVAKNRAEREEAAKEFTHRRTLMEMSREQEIQKTRLINLQELKRADLRGDKEWKDFLLASELNRDLVSEAQRVDLEQVESKVEDVQVEGALKRDLKVQEHRLDTSRVDAQISEIQMDLSRREGTIRLEHRRQEETLRMDVQDREFKQRQAARLAEIEADDKELSSMVRMQIQMASAKHDREMSQRRQELDADIRKQQAQVESEYQQRKLRLDEDQARLGMMERVLSQGIAKGAVDAIVLKAMVEQATEQSFATATDDKVRARSEADAAKHNLETHKQAYQQAEDRERQHQVTTTELSTEMMQAAKQQPAPAAIIMPGPSAVPMMPTPFASAGTPVNIVNVTPGASTSGSPTSVTSTCPQCGGDVQPGWKACPSCGAKLGAKTGACSSCGELLQSHWKACPHCGQKV